MQRPWCGAKQVAAPDRYYVKHHIDFAEKTIELVKEITLEVRQSNLPAINLYRHLNFISHKIISGYYSDGEDAVLMKYFV